MRKPRESKGNRRWVQLYLYIRHRRRVSLRAVDGILTHLSIVRQHVLTNRLLHNSFGECGVRVVVRLRPRLPCWARGGGSTPLQRPLHTYKALCPICRDPPKGTVF